MAADMKLPTSLSKQLSDDELEQLYNLTAWEQPSNSGKYSSTTALSITLTITKIAASCNFNCYRRAWLTTQSRRLAHHIEPIHRLILLASA
jgi:hypothetical protein